MNNFEEVVEVIKKSGIKKTICCGTGSMIMNLYSIINNEVQCEYVNYERTASFFALGKSQINKEPIMIIVEFGISMLHLLSGITEAYYQDIPIVVLALKQNVNNISRTDILHSFKGVSEIINIEKPDDIVKVINKHKPIISVYMLKSSEQYDSNKEMKSLIALTEKIIDNNIFVGNDLDSYGELAICLGRASVIKQNCFILVNSNTVSQELNSMWIRHNESNVRIICNSKGLAGYFSCWAEEMGFDYHSVNQKKDYIDILIKMKENTDKPQFIEVNMLEE